MESSFHVHCQWPWPGEEFELCNYVARISQFNKPQISSFQYVWLMICVGTMGGVCRLWSQHIAVDEPLRNQFCQAKLANCRCVCEPSNRVCEAPTRSLPTMTGVCEPNLQVSRTSHEPKAGGTNFREWIIYHPRNNTDPFRLALNLPLQRGFQRTWENLFLNAWRTIRIIKSWTMAFWCLLYYFFRDHKILLEFEQSFKPRRFSKKTGFSWPAHLSSFLGVQVAWQGSSSQSSSSIAGLLCSRLCAKLSCPQCASSVIQPTGMRRWALPHDLQSLRPATERVSHKKTTLIWIAHVCLNLQIFEFNGC